MTSQKLVFSDGLRHARSHRFSHRKRFRSPNDDAGVDQWLIARLRPSDNSRDWKSAGARNARPAELGQSVDRLG